MSTESVVMSATSDTTAESHENEFVVDFAEGVYLTNFYKLILYSVKFS